MAIYPRSKTTELSTHTGDERESGGRVLRPPFRVTGYVTLSPFTSTIAARRCVAWERTRTYERYATKYIKLLLMEISIACLHGIYNIRTVLLFLQEHN